MTTPKLNYLRKTGFGERFKLVVSGNKIPILISTVVDDKNLIQMLDSYQETIVLHKIYRKSWKIM